MPRLKRLLDGASDADDAAEHLLTRPLHDLAQREQRREAAAVCAAPGLKVSALLGEDELLGDIDGDFAMAQGLKAASLHDCVLTAIEAAMHDKPTLFIVPSAILVAKGIRNAMASMDVDSATGHPSLARIRIHQTTDIHVLLSILDDVQRNPDPPAHIFLGPLCMLFTPFLTSNGLTITGDGLLRMVQLACRRVRAARSSINVTLLQPGPLFGSS